MGKKSNGSWNTFKISDCSDPYRWNDKMLTQFNVELYKKQTIRKEPTVVEVMMYENGELVYYYVVGLDNDKCAVFKGSSTTSMSKQKALSLADEIHNKFYSNSSEEKDVKEKNSVYNLVKNIDSDDVKSLVGNTIDKIDKKTALSMGIGVIGGGVVLSLLKSKDRNIK